jgi:ubiquinone/menaquinone biosynthesis C-methylase UbiE
MNRLGRAVLNSPARAAAQRRHVVPTMARLGVDLAGCDVLEVGCGCGAGTELLVELLHPRSIRAIDIDPVMVRLARQRVDGQAQVEVGDMLEIEADDDAYDAVVDMGAIHIEPRWRDALAEVARVLRPGGCFAFEEIVRPSRQALSTLAVGCRLRSGFAHHPFLDELEAHRLRLVAVDESLPPALTGMVGDLVGVAFAAGPGVSPVGGNGQH